MSQKKIAEIEDYLLGRIAQLEYMLSASEIPKKKAPGVVSLINENRKTLKKVREIGK